MNLQEGIDALPATNNPQAPGLSISERKESVFRK